MDSVHASPVICLVLTVLSFLIREVIRFLIVRQAIRGASPTQRPAILHELPAIFQSSAWRSSREARLSAKESITLHGPRTRTR